VNGYCELNVRTAGTIWFCFKFSLTDKLSDHATMAANAALSQCCAVAVKDQANGMGAFGGR
jgi:hypothetical protein